MNRPEMKREATITWSDALRGRIHFTATSDALEDARAFGMVERGAAPQQYMMDIDPRYDFAEVIAYLKELWA